MFNPSKFCKGSCNLKKQCISLKQSILDKASMGIIPGPWQWKSQGLITGPAGKAPHRLISASVFTLHPACMSSHRLLPVYVHFPIFEGCPSYCIRAHHPNDLILTWMQSWIANLNLQRCYCQLRSHCEVLRVRTSIYLFGRVQFSPQYVCKIINFQILIFFFFLIFELKDNCFTEFCGFLSYISENQFLLYVYFFLQLM